MHLVETSSPAEIPALLGELETDSRHGAGAIVVAGRSLPAR
jgi:hypothetical protein